MRHIEPHVTDRGFRHLPPVLGSHDGEVRVYESSAASAPHVWLSVRETEATAMFERSITLHLTAEAAWQLADQLRWLVVHHYQGDARPANTLDDDDDDDDDGNDDVDRSTGSGS